MSHAAPTYEFVITGHFSSGKSTFIRTISELEVVTSESQFNPPPERIQVNMDFGRISVEGGAFYLRATPGARRFDFMWEIMAGNTMAGFIVMVDSTRPEQFRETRSILETFTVYTEMPCVVAANFQDRPGAWDAEAIQIMLKIPTDVPVVPCIATDRKSVANVLLALCYKILEAGETDSAEK